VSETKPTDEALREACVLHADPEKVEFTATSERDHQHVVESGFCICNALRAWGERCGDRYADLRANVTTACDLLELGDQRELAKDGPVGDGSACFLNLDDAEKRQFYLAISGIRDAEVWTKATPTAYDRGKADGAREERERLTGTDDPSMADLIASGGFPEAHDGYVAAGRNQGLRDAADWLKHNAHIGGPGLGFPRAEEAILAMQTGDTDGE